MAKICPSSGMLDYSSLNATEENATKEYAAFVFPQVNKFGLLENVDALTDFARERGMRSIASIDPMLLATGGLKPRASLGKRALISSLEKPNTWPYPRLSVARVSACSVVASTKSTKRIFVPLLVVMSAEPRTSTEEIVSSWFFLPANST